MKNTANVITGLRIILAVIMVYSTLFSLLFWLCYIGCGISDIADGIVARKMNQESVFGAKLDSIADAIFALALCVIIVLKYHFPTWIWVLIIGVALTRIAGYIIGLYKYHTFSALHTYANKITGFVLFLSPALIYIIGINSSAIILCVIAGVSSIEEIIITTKSKTLDRDCKGIFIR